MSTSEYLGIRDWRPLGWPTAHICDVCGVTVSDEARAAKHQAWHALVDTLIEREAGTINPGLRVAAATAKPGSSLVDGGSTPGATSSALGDLIRAEGAELRGMATGEPYVVGVRPGDLTGVATVLDDIARDVDALTAERDRLRDDYDRTAEAADRAAVRLREVEAERDDLRESARGWERTAAEKMRERDEARAQRDAVAITAERMTSYARQAEAALARVRALLDGRAMVPVGLLAEALDGEGSKLAPLASAVTAPEGARAADGPRDGGEICGPQEADDVSERGWSR